MISIVILFTMEPPCHDSDVWQNFVKQASRAQILDKATEYIQYMRRKNHTHQQDIDDLKKQNALLEQQGKCEFESISYLFHFLYFNNY